MFWLDETVAVAAGAHACANGLGRVFSDFARSRADALPFRETAADPIQ
jgi:hypothetical protein